MVAKVFLNNAVMECIAFKGETEVTRPAPVERAVRRDMSAPADLGKSAADFLEAVVRIWASSAQPAE